MKMNLHFRVVFTLTVLILFVFGMVGLRRFRSAPFVDSGHGTTALKSRDSSVNNWRNGLTEKQIEDKIKDEVKTLGPAGLWKRELESKAESALRIQDGKKFSELEALLDKISPFLTYKKTLASGSGVELIDLDQAKRAVAVFTDDFSLGLPAKCYLYNGIVYFSMPERSPLYRSKLHPEGGYIMNKTDFSSGWALRLGQKEKVILMKWNASTTVGLEDVKGVATESD